VARIDRWADFLFREVEIVAAFLATRPGVVTLVRRAVSTMRASGGSVPR